jgi:hypothetical protein
MVNMMIDEHTHSDTSEMSIEEMESILMNRLHDCSESSLEDSEIQTQNKNPDKTDNQWTARVQAKLNHINIHSHIC